MKNVLVILPLEEEEKAFLRSRTEGAAEEYSFAFYPVISEVPDEAIASAQIII